MRRPRTLGRYIASRFLLGIVVTFLLCSVLIFLIDFVELLRQSGKYGEVSLLTLALIAAGMSLGARKRASSGSMSAAKGATASTWANSVS